MTKTQVTITLADCPTDAVMDANLDAWMSRATVAQMVDGTGWYERAREWCASRAVDHGVTTERVAAIVAVLSPMTEWGYNIDMADALLRDPYATTIDGRRRFCGYPVNIAKARAMAQGGPIKVTGQKVERFYAAILGVDSIATIDSWATRAATMRMDVDAPGASYDRIARAYARFASRHGLNIHDAQAIVWSVVRNHGKAGKAGTTRVASIKRPS